MLRIQELSPSEQRQAAEEQKHWEAYSAAIAAAPQRFRQLRDAEREARRACRGIDKKYTNLSRAQRNAGCLHSELRKAGLIAEAAIVAGLLPTIEKQIEPILEDLEKADIEHTTAEAALNNEFRAP